MPDSPKPVTILIAEDDPDDRKMVKDAFDEARLGNEIVFVEDGVEVLDYLNRRGRFTDPLTSPWPSLLLLDLNMPRMDGHDVTGRRGHRQFLFALCRQFHHETGHVRIARRGCPHAWAILAGDCGATRQ